MADNAQNPQPPTPPSSAPTPYSALGPRTLASMPPLSIPPPTYEQVGPKPPYYTTVPLAPSVMPVRLPGLSPVRYPSTAAGGSQIAGPARPTIQPMRDAIPPRLPSPTPEPSEPEPQPYHLSIIHEWTPSPAELATTTSISTSSQPSRGRPPGVKKKAMSKPLALVLTDISRADFILAILRAHDLQDDYRVLADREGPPVKIWWQGSNGGRNGACTIETNTEFDHILNRILMRPPTTNVSALFCTDEMQEWRVRLGKRGVPQDGFEEIGRRPGPSNMANTETALHADIILVLKETHGCDTHTGDHGATGFCLILPGDVHIILTHLHFKIWAAALAAGNATPENPPEHDMFRDPNRLMNGPSVFPPVRVGRAASRRAPPATSPSDPMSLATGMLLAGALAAFNNPNPSALAMLSNQLGIQAPVSPAAPQLNAPSANLPRTPSPVPEPGAELHACLAAFKEQSGVDLLDQVSVLQDRELGPDIIHKVPYEHLTKLLGVAEGQALRFQEFSREWYNKLKAKSPKK